MENFIMRFAEKSKSDHQNEDLNIEYSNKLNLNVIKNTPIPAVTFNREALETTTHTMQERESTDTDPNTSELMNPVVAEIASSNMSVYPFRSYLDTHTCTAAEKEVTDLD